MKERLSSGSRGISTPPYFITFLSYFSRYVTRRTYTTAISVGQEDSPDFSLCVSGIDPGYWSASTKNDNSISNTPTRIHSSSAKKTLQLNPDISFPVLYDPDDMTDLNGNLILIHQPSVLGSFQFSKRIYELFQSTIDLDRFIVSVHGINHTLHNRISSVRYLNPSEILV